MSSDNPLEGYPVDDDYIGVESERADVSESDEEENPELDRSEQSVDHSHRYRGGYESLSRAEQRRRERDEASYVTHDGRAETRTTFWGDEGPTKGPLRSDGRRIAWSRLAKWNDGMWSTGRETKNNAADARRWLSIFSTQLEINDRQRARSLEVIEDLNMSHMAHYNTETVILAIISLVANVGGRWIRDEKTFRELVVASDTDMADIKQCRQLVKEKSDL